MGNWKAAQRDGHDGPSGELLTSRYLAAGGMETARAGLASEAVAQSDGTESLLDMLVGTADCIYAAYLFAFMGGE